MAPVVTASRRRGNKGRGPVIGAIAAIALAAVVAVIVLSRGKGEKTVPVTDTTPTVNQPAANDYGKQSSKTVSETAAKKTVVAPRSEDDAGEADARADVLAEAASVEEEPAEEEPVDEEAEARARRPKTFKHPTEELLGLMMSTPPTCAMPPLPQLDPNDERLNADALLSTTNLLVIYEDDDEKTAAWKEEVAAAKFQLAAVTTNGGSVAEALNELRDYQNSGVAVRKEVIKSVNEIEDDTEAYEYLEKANEALKEEDIVPIELDEVGMEVVE